MSDESTRLVALLIEVASLVLLFLLVFDRLHHVTKRLDHLQCELDQLNQRLEQLTTQDAEDDAVLRSY